MVDSLWRARAGRAGRATRAPSMLHRVNQLNFWWWYAAATITVVAGYYTSPGLKVANNLQGKMALNRLSIW